MFKCRLNAEISDPSCCSSFGTCLDCMLRGIKSPLVWDFFLHSSHFSYMFLTPCIHRLCAFSQFPNGMAFTEYCMLGIMEVWVFLAKNTTQKIMLHKTILAPGTYWLQLKSASIMALNAANRLLQSFKEFFNGIFY